MTRSDLELSPPELRSPPSLPGGALGSLGLSSIERGIPGGAAHAAQHGVDVQAGLLERLPDDCNLDDVIDRLYELQLLESNESNAPPLTQAQRTELDRRLDRLMQDPGRTIPWADVRRKLERSR